MKNGILTGLVCFLSAITILSVRDMRESERKYQEVLDARPLPPEYPVRYLTKGTSLGQENYITKSGNKYIVPLLADGKGGYTRWLADVPWADLPIETRLGFAMRGGGMLNPQDLQDAWDKFGQWRKTGETIGIVVHQKSEG